MDDINTDVPEHKVNIKTDPDANPFSPELIPSVPITIYVQCFNGTMAPKDYRNEKCKKRIFGKKYIIDETEEEKIAAAKRLKAAIGLKFRKIYHKKSARKNASGQKPTGK